MQKVLIIMKQDSLQDALRKDLQKDFEVVTCSNAEEGAVLLQDKPDVLIADLFLPGTDGLTFLIQNRAQLPPTVIVLTVFISTKVLRQLEELGVSAVIRRPCTVRAITSALAACV